MGKTKYAAESSTNSVNPYTPPQCVEPMPQVPKASCFVGSPRKRANTRTPDAAAHLSVTKICSDALIYKTDDGLCLFPGLITPNQSVYLVTLSHSKGYPQIDFKFTEKMDVMLKKKVEEDPQRPRDWEDLMQRLHICKHWYIRAIQCAISELAASFLCGRWGSSMPEFHNGA